MSGKSTPSSLGKKPSMPPRAVSLKVQKANSNAPAPPRAVAGKPIVRIGILVHDVARMRKTIFDQAVAEMGITRAQWWALANVSRHATEGMNQSDLARVLGVGKPTIGGFIDRLSEKGLVERRSLDGDRRVKNIYITDYGNELIFHMSPIAASLNNVFLEGIDEKDIKVAEAVLEQMKQNLERLFGSSSTVKLPKAFKRKVASMRSVG